MHWRQRRLLQRGIEFHVCTINKNAHTKKVWKLIVSTLYLLWLVVSWKLVLWHVVYCFNLYDLKATLMNVQHSLIQELYKFYLGYSAVETIKNVCCVKVAVHHRTIIRQLKKFCLGCKNLNIWHLSLTFYSLVWFITFHNFRSKSVLSWWIMPHINKILQNFWLILI